MGATRIGLLALLAAAPPLAAETICLPAVASIVGGAPFVSDVRAFNTSYTEDLAVEARYRCYRSPTSAARTAR